MTSNSTIDLIRKARTSALDDFKMRFKQKWLGDFPCFHWRELKLSKEMKTNFEQKNSAFYLLSFTDEILDVEDKTWENHDLESTLILEEMKMESHSFEKASLEDWLESNIEMVKKENTLNRENLILCYREGTTSFAKEWRTQFEKQLKF